MLWPLRVLLNACGFRARGWGLGTNRGNVEQMTADFLNVVQGEYARNGGKPLHLVGWSLGGVLARELARACPEHVRQVITLGSPIGGNPKATTIWRLYELATETRLDSEELQARIARMVEPPPGVPCTAIYSESDGIVAHEIARERETALTQSIRVSASHVGLGYSAAVMFLLADRLAQPEGAWTKFRRPRLGTFALA